MLQNPKKKISEAKQGLKTGSGRSRGAQGPQVGEMEDPMLAWGAGRATAIPGFSFPFCGVPASRTGGPAPALVGPTTEAPLSLAIKLAPLTLFLCLLLLPLLD